MEGVYKGKIKYSKRLVNEKKCKNEVKGRRWE